MRRKSAHRVPPSVQASNNLTVSGIIKAPNSPLSGNGYVKRQRHDNIIELTPADAEDSDSVKVCQESTSDCQSYRITLQAVLKPHEKESRVKINALWLTATENRAALLIDDDLPRGPFAKPSILITAADRDEAKRRRRWVAAATESIRDDVINLIAEQPNTETVVRRSEAWKVASVDISTARTHLGANYSPEPEKLRRLLDSIGRKLLSEASHEARSPNISLDIKDKTLIPYVVHRHDADTRFAQFANEVRGKARADGMDLKPYSLSEKETRAARLAASRLSTSDDLPLEAYATDLTDSLERLLRFRLDFSEPVAQSVAPLLSEHATQLGVNSPDPVPDWIRNSIMGPASWHWASSFTLEHGPHPYAVLPLVAISDPRGALEQATDLVSDANPHPTFICCGCGREYSDEDGHWGCEECSISEYGYPIDNEPRGSDHQPLGGACDVCLSSVPKIHSHHPIKQRHLAIRDRRIEDGIIKIHRGRCPSALHIGHYKLDKALAKPADSKYARLRPANLALVGASLLSLMDKGARPESLQSGAYSLYRLIAGIEK